MNEDFSKYEELNKPLSSFESAEYRNEWQLCPKCNGVGLIDPLSSSDTVISTLPVSCDLCNGKKIISKITGSPPE